MAGKTLQFKHLIGSGRELNPYGGLGDRYLILQNRDQTINSTWDELKAFAPDRVLMDARKDNFLLNNKKLQWKGGG
jgi:hypothetical protein